MAQRVLAVPTPSSELYLGFVDGAVESVVLLIVEQTEIQRPQRGCKGGEMGLSGSTQQTRAALPLSTKERTEMLKSRLQTVQNTNHPAGSPVMKRGSVLGACWPLPGCRAQPWERRERDERAQLAQRCSRSLCSRGLSPGLSPSLSAASSSPCPRRWRVSSGKVWEWLGHS